MVPHAAPSILFGWDPMITAVTILVVAYAFIISEKVNRAVASLIGAGAMVLVGVLNQDAAVRGVDFNTIALLVGMMVIVGITRRSGVFQFAALFTAQMVKGHPRLLLAALAAVTAIFSAFLDNVTTVLLVIPVTLALVDQLKIKAYPFLFSQIFASNIGGTATLIGDPPNILIGSATGYSFMDFVDNVGMPALIIMIACMVIFDVIWGRRMSATAEDRAALMKMNPHASITDRPLLWKALGVLALVLFGFIYGHDHGLMPGTVALTGAALLMLLDSLKLKPEAQSEKAHHAFCEVEWITIFFFVGLFVIVHGVQSTGLLDIMAQKMLTVTGGDMRATGMLILWSSAILSAVLDNIPFVATMIPMIQAMGPSLGGPEVLEPLWWCLSLGACLGGNGTLIGASANVTVAGFAERAGQRIPFMQFMALAFPLMIFTIVIAAVYAWFVYF